MQREQVQIQHVTLVGLTTRTNNANEMNPETSKIMQLAGTYWQDGIANNIQHRKNPGTTYAVYTDFESDENGDYTYFIGEAVDALEDQDLSRFQTVSIPEGSYQKFTTPPGKMPDVVIEAWQKIWAMKEEGFGGRRAYRADFEIYDQRAQDPTQVVLDIYIGVEKI